MLNSVRSAYVPHGESDEHPGWPPALLALVDSLVISQPSRRGGALLESMPDKSSLGQDFGSDGAQFLLDLQHDTYFNLRGTMPAAL